MAKKILDSITLPAGLRKLTVNELETVAAELREELIEVIAQSGGHFASSLGATEITVALHHLFDTPRDMIVWDVGHQAYVHKMLTGRRDRLKTIRKKDGLSGFLKRSESEYDTFGAGHAGTSISAAVGMALAFKRDEAEQLAEGKKVTKKYVVAVIGDGSMTSGMAFEALNHAGDLGLSNLIVILNDNEMSISPNVGAISWLFSRATTTHLASRARNKFKQLFKEGYVPELLYKVVDRAEEATQSFFASPSMLFGSFGFRYIGPIDGHNIKDLTTALLHAKDQDVPTIIHTSTVKGKGYIFAEEDPLKWHGVSPFSKSNGEFLANIKPEVKKDPPSYTSIFADALIKLCQQDKKIIGITAAMPSGTGLDKLQKVCPENFIDVGICEQHAVTFAAGLAVSGLKPVCAIYSTFLQRGYDQVVHDVAIQNLAVVFAMDRGGVVGNDGETHQGVFDIAFLRTVPQMTIMSPKDENEMQHMLYTAVEYGIPVALRYPRGNGSGVELDKEFQKIPLGKGEIIKEGKDILFISFGPVISYVDDVTKRLEEENSGLTCTIINARFAKPLDVELLSQEIPKYKLVCTVEDHAIMGGFGSAVIEAVNDSNIPCKNTILRFGVKDDFVPHATQSEQHKDNGYDAEGIYKSVVARIGDFFSKVTTSEKAEIALKDEVIVNG